MIENNKQVPQEEEMSFELTDEIIFKLRTFAKEENKSINEFINELLEEAIKEENESED
ncbi:MULTISPECIES: hypothetical protein [Prochlorococcus]|uniref:hypothetical protein n=1 Tax=Prochlorococcus TaxID=1218 RepID=UPI0002DA8B19|nr:MULTISPECIES: hypothetical protein [Prochlorococcus]KGG10951.1 hypothetical protein EV04_1915 [Prochlorococcus marinus str. LG]KGG19958.1 hypothetical protein EV08_1190 [Prochlorococcus marinus str. SS2]KGG24200.1 hypothetical protein EV09_0807 [Prochlorococcus marinus str. SS35]KGG31543.1 hypothetical protein EV10_1636 [Prochlorococcus marinus str. SS51]